MALVLLCALAAYFNSFHGTFQFDDLRTIRFNFSLRDLTDWKNIFLSEQSRPLLNATFAFNYSISRLDPFSYHVVNFLIHSINLLLLYQLLRKTTDSIGVCFVATVLMAVHPLNTESVTYVSSRSILLCSSFYLSGLLLFDAYLRKGKILFAVLFLVAFITGCLIKEEMAMVPVAALLYNYFFFGKDTVRKHFRFHLFTFCLLAAVALLRLSLLFQNVRLPHSFFIYFATETKVIWNYVWLAIYPVHLNVDPDIEALSPIHFLFWFFLLLHAVALSLLWRARKRHPFLAFWGLWFWLNLLLSSSLFPLNDFMAEHRSYLSLFGFCSVAAYAAMILWMPRTSHRMLVPTILAVIVLFLSIATFQRNRVWSNELTLWLDTVQKSPEKARAHINLGGAYTQRQLYDLAITQYRYALLLSPQIAQAYGGLGICYLNRNHLNLAGKYFEQALKIDPDYSDGSVGLGMVYYRKRNYEKTLTYLLPLYSKRRESVQIVGMIANSYIHTRQYKEAIPFLKEFIRMKPDHKVAHFDLLRSYVFSDQFEEAMEYFQKSRNQFPPAGRDWLVLCDVLIQKGRNQDAVRILKSLHSTDPNWKSEVEKRVKAEAV